MSDVEWKEIIAETKLMAREKKKATKNRWRGHKDPYTCYIEEKNILTRFVIR